MHTLTIAQDMFSFPCDNFIPGKSRYIPDIFFNLHTLSSATPILPFYGNTKVVPANKIVCNFKNCVQLAKYSYR